MNLLLTITLVTAAGPLGLAAATDPPLRFQIHKDEHRLSSAIAEPGWQVHLEPMFDILGPFPQHAREQNYLSPLYPLDFADLNEWLSGTTKKYYSSLAENGTVIWSTAPIQDGHLTVSYPSISWETLRRTEGWAALQHHTLAHSKIVLTPVEQEEGCTPPLLQADVRQVSFFSITPELTSNYTLEWHTGNIYDLSRTPKEVMPLPTTPRCNETTVYHLFASLDYEIRLFGDPLDVEKVEYPIHRSSFEFSTVAPTAGIIREERLDIIPDSVDGWLFTDRSIGLGFSSGNQSWELTNVVSGIDAFYAGFILPEQLRLAPGQPRTLRIRLTQQKRWTGKSIPISLSFADANDTFPRLEMEITIPIVQKPAWSLDSEEVYKGVYLLAGIPTYYMFKPPMTCNAQSPAVVALHGAGVEADHPIWTGSIRRQASSWVIFPTGGTPWGLDWHGISAQNALASVEALRGILQSRAIWKSCIVWEERVVLVGHSNGGQGVWYIASRFPSRVLAAVPAAAYIRSQQYVSTGLSHGAHFADTTLRGILDAALQPDDNDLFLTNLVSTPILSIHGSSDRNVPPWHGRELVSIVKHWYPNATVSLREVPNKPHWWNEVLADDPVQSFIDNAVAKLPTEPPSPFTLTTALPSESGPLRGITIAQMSTPGRMGRLSASKEDNTLFISTTNVQSFSVSLREWQDQVRLDYVEVDGARFITNWEQGDAWFSRKDKKWELSLFLGKDPRRTGPMSQILSDGPLFIVIPKDKPSLLSAALRISFNLLTYLRVDSQIMFDDDKDYNLRKCVNMIILGGQDNKFGESFLARRPSEFKFTEGGWTLRGYEYSQPGSGVAFLHSHPSCSKLTLFVSATDESGWERILRLLPLRTGIATPEWIITGPKADKMGIGGLLGAGFWGRDWEWSETMSWTQW